MLERVLQHWQRAVLVSVIILGYIEWLLLAWVDDDAFISFRVVDNFVNGYGLRWNIYERVQAYTNPLWTLLHIPFYAVWPNIFLITLALSFVCTAGAIAIVLRTWKKPPLIAACCFLLPLMLSYSFAVYTSSGLEIPLSYLLFAAFGWASTRAPMQTHWLWISLFAALAMVNRLDTGLIYAPPIIYLLIRDYCRNGQLPLRQMLPGILLISGWMLFSLFYYGFLFPNTKYAKLGTGMTFSENVMQGEGYFYSLFSTDLAGICILACGVFAYVTSISGWFQQKVDGLKAAFLFGAFSYCFYILCIGGDFMLNRFFALPVFVVAWTLYKDVSPHFPTRLVCIAIIALLVGAMCGWFYIPATVSQVRHYAKYGVDDEHDFYAFGGNGLIDRKIQGFRTKAEFGWVNLGLQMHKGDPGRVLFIGNIGMQGFYAGPKIRLIDWWALSDPLLARMPMTSGRRRIMLIGHYDRDLPRGYLYAVATGSTEKMDSNLAQYYEKLRLITQGDLWSWERIETIIAFNLGFYEHWRKAYLKQ
jgi:arabinofuranosyltransferase